MLLWEDTVLSPSTTLAEGAGSPRAPEIFKYCNFHLWARYFLDTESQPICQSSHVGLSCNISSNYFSLLDDLLRFQGCCCCSCCLQSPAEPASTQQSFSAPHLIWSRLVPRWLGAASPGIGNIAIKWPWDVRDSLSVSNRVSNSCSGQTFRKQQEWYKLLWCFYSDVLLVTVTFHSGAFPHVMLFAHLGTFWGCLSQSLA